MEKKHTDQSPETAAIIKKYRKQIYLTTLCAILSLAIIIGASAAWLANNRKVNAEGMKIKVETSSNLVISDATKGFPNPITNIEPYFKVTFEGGPASLTPARHQESSTATKLEYNTNPGAVSPSTGLQAVGADALVFLPVPEESESTTPRHYKDYTVYIAASGQAFDAQSLTATLTSVPDANKEFLNAATIDFYVNDTYVDTLNAAGKNWSDSTTAQTSIELLKDGSATIPLYTGTPITILMRCYFDGGLLKDGGNAYIASDFVDATGCTLNVTFIATDATATP